MKYIFLCLILSNFIFYSCGFNEYKIDNFDKRAINNSYSNIVNEDSLTLLGKGFSTIESSIKNNCLKNVPIKFIKEPETKLIFKKNIALKEIVEILKIKFDTEYQRNNFKILLSSAFLNSLEQNNLASSMTTISYNKLGKFILDEQRVNKLRIFEEYKNILKISPSNFIQLCGNEVINSYDLVSYIIINVKFSYSDETAKQYFDNIFHSNLDLFEYFSNNNISNLNFHSEKSLNNVSILVSGIQIGGDAEKLNKIFNGSCTFNNISTCINLFTKINEYITNDYIEQIDNNLFSKWIPINLTSVPYGNILELSNSSEIENLNQNINSEFKEFTKKINDFKSEIYKNYTKQKKLISSDKFKYFSKTEKESIYQEIKYHEDLFNNLSNLYNKCNTTYNFNSCMQNKIYDNLNDLYNIYNKKSKLVINKFVTSFSLNKENIYIENKYVKNKKISNLFLNNKMMYIFHDAEENEVNNEFISIICPVKTFDKILTFNISEIFKTTFKILGKFKNRDDFSISKYNLNESCSSIDNLYFSANINSKINKVVVWEVP